MSRKCRLRSYKSIGDDGKWAADRIEQLENQRDELKSTLDAIAEIAAKYSGDYPLQVLTIASEAIATIRTTLGETE